MFGLQVTKRHVHVGEIITRTSNFCPTISLLIDENERKCWLNHQQITQNSYKGYLHDSKSHGTYWLLFEIHSNSQNHKRIEMLRNRKWHGDWCLLQSYRSTESFATHSSSWELHHYEKLMLTSMLINMDFLTWLLIYLQLWWLQIRSYVSLIHVN